MKTFTWTTTVTIEADTEEDSFAKLIDKETQDMGWEIESIEET